jgi:hypothetical protein
VLRESLWGHLVFVHPSATQWFAVGDHESLYCPFRGRCLIEGGAPSPASRGLSRASEELTVNERWRWITKLTRKEPI